MLLASDRLLIYSQEPLLIHLLEGLHKLYKQVLGKQPPKLSLLWSQAHNFKG